MAESQSGINTKLPSIEDKDSKKEILEAFEIDALEFLEGKMCCVAMEHLHRQILSNNLGLK